MKLEVFRAGLSTAPPRGRSAQVFMQAEDVAFGVLEPGGLLGSEHADVLDGLQARQIIVGEFHAARLEVADDAGAARDLEAQGGVLRLGAVGPREQRDFRAAATVDELAVGLLAK